MAIYCDLDSLLSKNTFGVVTNVYDTESVKQSVYTILQTRKGERVMRPNFGTNLHQMLFEPMSDSVARDIRYEIVSALTEWEDRIVINDVTVIPSYDSNVYVVDISYRVIKNSKSENIILGLPKV